MGEVWRAEHDLLARPAAVKLIRPEVLGETNGGSALALRRSSEKPRPLPYCILCTPLAFTISVRRPTRPFIM